MLRCSAILPIPYILAAGATRLTRAYGAGPNCKMLRGVSVRAVLLAAVVGSLCCASTSGRAQPPAPSSDTGWSGSVTPYVWFAGIDGDATVRGHSDSGAASFGDIFDDMKFALMTTAEVRNGRIGVLVDLLYLDLEQGVSTPRDIAFDGGSGTVRMTGLGIAAMYRFIEDARGVLDAGAGIRPWWVDTRLRLNPGRAAGRSFNTSSQWADPVIALRGQLRLSGPLSVSAYGDIGGFGVGSDLTWQVTATVDWQPNEWLMLRAGWRHLAFDFKNGPASLDLAVSGPIIGASFRF